MSFPLFLNLLQIVDFLEAKHVKGQPFICFPFIQDTLSFIHSKNHLFMTVQDTLSFIHSENCCAVLVSGANFRICLQLVGFLERKANK
jgi:hypothetical protein